MPFYPAADRDVQPVPAPGVACRCCRGGISRSRRTCRYPSDMTGAEWAVCEPLLPVPAWLAGRGGRPASWCMRDVVDAIRYLTHNGPVWRALPADFPPAGTVYWWLDKWQADGSAEQMHDDLRGRVRLAAGRTAAPTAAVIDSQSVKGSEMIARTRRGYDAGKKTSDAVDVSSGQGGTCLSFCREGGVLVEAGAVGQAVMKAAEHAVEEVALGGCVLVPGFAPSVVVRPCSS